MELQRITSADHPLFGSVWQIYRDSFPRNERRTLEHQQTAFQSNQYHLNAYTEKGTLLGLLGYWEFDDYIYIEHLAINPVIRSGGHGSRILSALIESTSKALILEIEPVENDLTLRRLRFYERLGFQETSYPHRQHRYHDDDPEDFRLVILCHPQIISPELYKQFDDDLQAIVMKK